MIQFDKYHGTGNDFIILNGITNTYENPSKIAIDICDRHFGVGADGLIIVSKSEECDVRMDYYNADGTVAPMCGNGIRCFSKFIDDHHLVGKDSFYVETLAGTMKIELIKEENTVKEIKVNLGKPSFVTTALNFNTDKETLINEVIKIEGKDYLITALNMGTLHCVVYLPTLDEEEMKRIAPKIEQHSLFPNKINVNFCQINSPSDLKVVTYERGVGFTLSCGTGACAVAVVSSLLYLTERTAKVENRGGTLTIEQKADGVYLIGPAKRICFGEYIERSEHFE